MASGNFENLLVDIAEVGNGYTVALWHRADADAAGMLLADVSAVSISSAIELAKGMAEDRGIPKERIEVKVILGRPSRRLADFA